MNRLAPLVLALCPAIAYADGWEATTELVPLLDGSSAIAGDQIGLPFEVDSTAWLNSEVVTRDNTQPLDCTLNDNLELNHFYGIAGLYAVDLFANLAQTDDGAWAVEPLEYYLDLAEPEATYLGTELTATLDTFDCLGSETVIGISYSAIFVLEEGVGPDEFTMTGMARMTLPITRFVPFQ